MSSNPVKAVDICFFTAFAFSLYLEALRRADT